MKTTKFCVLSIVFFVATTFVHGQATRTWVSGVGDDANPCSRTAPCKTFAGAFAKTAAGGEMDALDPGGYGAVTITKAITIDGGGGQVASVLVSFTNGIIVNAGPNDTVILKNLRLNGIGTGLNGIVFLAGGDLEVENCAISNFGDAGIQFNLLQPGGSAHIENTTFDNVNVGVSTQSGSSTPVQVGISHTSVKHAFSAGILVGANSQVVVRDSAMESNADGIAAVRGGQVTVSGSDLSNNQNGLVTSTAGVATVSSSDVNFNANCSLQNSGGTLITLGNNRINGGVFCGPISTGKEQ